MAIRVQKPCGAHQNRAEVIFYMLLKKPSISIKTSLAREKHSDFFLFQPTIM